MIIPEKIKSKIDNTTYQKIKKPKMDHKRLYTKTSKYKYDHKTQYQKNKHFKWTT